jgi:hypothetical protein
MPGGCGDNRWSGVRALREDCTGGLDCRRLQGPSLVGTSNQSFICMYSSFGGGEGMFDEGEGDDPKGCDVVSKQ